MKEKIPAMEIPSMMTRKINNQVKEKEEKNPIYIYDRKGKLYHIYMTGKEKELSYI
jgi:hypothetical protein